MDQEDIDNKSQKIKQIIEVLKFALKANDPEIISITIESALDILQELDDVNP